MTSAVARYFVLVHRHLLPLVLPREIPPVRYLSAPLALADASPFVAVSPAALRPLFPVPSGLRGSPLFVTSFWPLRLRVTSFWSFVTSPGVRFLPLAPGARGHPLYRHLLVVLASTRPFLLALRHYVLAPRRVCRFPVAISPGPSPGGPSWFLPGLRRPALLRTLLI